MITNMDIAEHLKMHNVKPSAQRMAILKYLVEYRNHPTADQIYSHLVTEMPTLSRTTVYNTMKLLLEKGAIIELGIDNKNARFDADTTLHAHLKCVKCGRIYDFPLDEKMQMSLSQVTDFQIDSIKLYYDGVCSKCK